MVAMTNLANMIQTSAAATAHAMERMGQGNGNGTGEGTGNNLGVGPITLAAFPKLKPPTFKGLVNPTEADNWFQAMERALQAQHVPKTSSWSL
ncbi:hypothetical protein AHAS_Ahas18G0171400 [Arachis hypogaea]